MRRIFVIWLPMWKCMRCRQSCMPFSSRMLNASSSSDDVRPNFEASPPLSSHLPEPDEASLIRMPRLGFTLSFLATLAMISSSFSFYHYENALPHLLCRSEEAHV